MYDTTPDSGDDPLRIVTRRLFRWGHLLEAHDHGGIRVTVSETIALGELAAAGELSQAELGSLLGLEKSTVSRLAQTMQARGWVTRDRDPDNRRYARLRLTPLGASVAARVDEHLGLLHRQLLGALTAQEREGLFAGLHGLVRVLALHGQHTTRSDERRG